MNILVFCASVVCFFFLIVRFFASIADYTRQRTMRALVEMSLAFVEFASFSVVLNALIW